MDSSISESDQNHFSKQGSQSTNRNRIANSLGPDETAQFEPSHQDLYCLQNKYFGLQGCKVQVRFSNIYANDSAASLQWPFARDPEHVCVRACMRVCVRMTCALRVRCCIRIYACFLCIAVDEQN